MTEREREGRLSAALQGFMVHWVQGAVWPVLLVYVCGGGQGGMVGGSASALQMWGFHLFCFCFRCLCTVLKLFETNYILLQVLSFLNYSMKYENVFLIKLQKEN